MGIYEKPTLTVYGSVQSLTGRLGGANEEDFLFGKDGVEATGTGSEDTCEASIDPDECLAVD